MWYETLECVPRDLLFVEFVNQRMNNFAVSSSMLLPMNVQHYPLLLTTFLFFTTFVIGNIFVRRPLSAIFQYGIWSF